MRRTGENEHSTKKNFISFCRVAMRLRREKEGTANAGGSSSSHQWRHLTAFSECNLGILSYITLLPLIKPPDARRALRMQQTVHRDPYNILWNSYEWKKYRKSFPSLQIVCFAAQHTRSLTPVCSMQFAASPTRAVSEWVWETGTRMNGTFRLSRVQQLPLLSLNSPL